MEMVSGTTRTWIALLVIAGVFQCTTAKSYIVGGATGWTLGIGPTFYDDWASKLTFFPGDVLVFTYSGALHNVLEVSKADLASCNYNNPENVYATLGGASVTLAAPGEHYYICGIPGHCLLNMQMTILVSPPGIAPSKPAAAPKHPKAPKSSRKSPTPAPTPDIAVPVPSVGLTNSVAPTPSKSGAPSISKDRSALAMIVGAILCVVSSLLLQ